MQILHLPRATWSVHVVVEVVCVYEDDSCSYEVVVVQQMVVAKLDNTYIVMFCWIVTVKQRQLTPWAWKPFLLHHSTQHVMHFMGMFGFSIYCKPPERVVVLQSQKINLCTGVVKYWGMCVWYFSATCVMIQQSHVVLCLTVSYAPAMLNTLSSFVYPSSWPTIRHAGMMHVKHIRARTRLPTTQYSDIHPSMCTHIKA